MTDFAYTAKSLTGERRSGVIAASSRAEAMQKLRAQSMFPMTLVDPQASRPAWTKISLPVRITKEQTADLCAQLADLLTNGVPMLESLKILADATENPRLSEACLRIHESVSQGDSLDSAMAKEPVLCSALKKIPRPIIE